MLNSGRKSTAGPIHPLIGSGKEVAQCGEMLEGDREIGNDY